MSVIGELGRVSSAKGTRGSRERRETKAAYVFLLPWFVGLFGITLAPMAVSLYLSFTDYSLLSAGNWIGLENFVRMFEDERLLNSLRVTLIYVLVGTPLQLMCALGIALLLDKGLKGAAFYRSLFYLPSLLGASVAVAILWRQLFGSNGLVNQLLGMIGIEGMGWISNPKTALATIILLHIWTFGAPMIIFLAGLRQIPTMYYEAAQMDGATSFQQFRKITMPLLSPIIFFNFVLGIIGAFQSFTQAFIVSGGSGGPADSTMFYTLYLYQQGFTRFDMGYASAMAWLLLVIIAGFTAINFIASKVWVFYDD